MRRLLLGIAVMPFLALQLASNEVAQGAIEMTDPTYLSAVKATFVLPVNNPLTDQVSASKAFLESGNDGASTLPLLASFFGGSDWTLVGKSDNTDPIPFQGNIDMPIGMLLVSTPPGSLDGPFAITLKAGSNYAAFYFDASVEDVIAFQFSTALAELFAGNPNNPQPAALSHASLYVPRIPPPDPDGEPSVPEPASLAVFSVLALIGGAGYYRRKQL